MERPRTGAMVERPKTRWSREQPDSLTMRNGSAAGIRSSSKMERPQSRRGTKIDIQSGRESARPVSTTFFVNNRASAMGSRINSAARINTGYAINTQRAFDRPVTGVRPGSTRGFPRLSRLVQDKRYYEGMIQLKIRELSQETDTIKRGIERQNKEKATFLHFDRRAKDLASELADLQGQLADYNTVLDKLTSNTEKALIEQAANELASINERTMSEIEEIFEQRQIAEQKLRNLQNDIDQEKRNAENIIAMMDSSTRQKYDELYNQKMQLKQEINLVQEEVDSLVSEKNKLEEGIALSQIKQEAVKLHVKIIEIENKRDRLLEERQNKLSPENEKTKLLERVKQDNVEITAAENQISEIKKRTADVEQELEQLEKDLNENYNEKGAKYKEFHKREEIMEEFLATFDENKAEESEKLKKLEKTVVERLEKMSSKMEGNLYFNDDDIFDIQIDNTTNPTNIEELKKQYISLQHNFIKMKALELKFNTEMKELKENIEKKQIELKHLDNFDELSVPKNLTYDELIEEKESLQNKQASCDNEFEDVQKELNDIEEQLNTNEIYGQINILEQKLESLKNNNDNTEKYIKNQQDRLNYKPLKHKATSLISQHNLKLLNLQIKK